MSFTGNLASTSGSGVYGGVAPIKTDDIMGFVDRIKDRNMEDFKNKLVFQQGLQNQQANLRQVFAPPGQLPATKGQPTTSMPNVVQQPDPNQMQNENQIPALAKAELGVKNKQLDVASQRLNQQMGYQNATLGIKDRQEQLNQQKSDQIDELKNKEREDRVNKALADIKQKGENADNLKEYRDAVEERHKAEMDKQSKQFEANQKRMQDQFDATHAQTQQKLDELIKANNQKGRSSQNTRINPDGSRTVITEKGDASDRVRVTGPDGKTYVIPKDKVDDWNKNHQPQQDENDNNDESGDESGDE